MQKKRHIPVTAVIFNDEGKVLLTKRFNPKNKFVHGKWQLPGGGIEYGEHPRETVMREIQEETKLTIKLLTKHPIVYSHVYGDNTHIVMLAYPAKYISGKLDIKGDTQATDGKWFADNEIIVADCLLETKDIVAEAREIIETK